MPSLSASPMMVGEQSKLYLELPNISNEFKLDGKTLLQWKEFVEVMLTCKGKLNHLHD